MEKGVKSTSQNAVFELQFPVREACTFGSFRSSGYFKTKLAPHDLFLSGFSPISLTGPDERELLKSVVSISPREQLLRFVCVCESFVCLGLPGVNLLHCVYAVPAWK